MKESLTTLFLEQPMALPGSANYVAGLQSDSMLKVLDKIPHTGNTNLSTCADSSTNTKIIPKKWAKQKYMSPVSLQKTVEKTDSPKNSFLFRYEHLKNNRSK